eukprot:s5278_g2.t1
MSKLVVLSLLIALADALQINVKVQDWHRGWSFQELLTCCEAIPLVVVLIVVFVAARPLLALSALSRHPQRHQQR